MKKLILTYGSISGLIVAAMLVVVFSKSTIDYDSGDFLGYAIMIIAFATIFVAVKSYRDKQLGGHINFATAFKLGLGITLVASAIYVIAWMIISNTIAKDFMTEYYQQSIEQLNASGLSDEELALRVEEMEQFRELYKNPFIKIGITFLEIFPVGLIISLISAAILKKKDQQETKL